jgi:hypothetical protein
MQLPVLVDGRDIFLQHGEVVGRAYLLYDDKQHYYHNQDRKKNLVKCWVMLNKQNPADRQYSWIPEDQLVFY